MQQNRPRRWKKATKRVHFLVGCTPKQALQHRNKYCRQIFYQLQKIALSPEHFFQLLSHARPHTFIQTHTSIDRYAIKAALDIPMETCIATSNVPTSQYKMYHDNVPCGKQIYRYGGLRKTVTSSRQGKPYQCWYRSTNRMEICVLASFIFVIKKLKSLVFRLHIWLHYWPFVPREIKKKQHPRYLTEHP